MTAFDKLYEKVTFKDVEDVVAPTVNKVTFGQNAYKLNMGDKGKVFDFSSDTIGESKITSLIFGGNAGSKGDGYSSGRDLQDAIEDMLKQDARDHLEGGDWGASDKDQRKAYKADSKTLELVDENGWAHEEFVGLVEMAMRGDQDKLAANLSVVDGELVLSLAVGGRFATDVLNFSGDFAVNALSQVDPDLLEEALDENTLQALAQEMALAMAKAGNMKGKNDASWIDISSTTEVSFHGDAMNGFSGAYSGQVVTEALKLFSDAQQILRSKGELSWGDPRLKDLHRIDTGDAHTQITWETDMPFQLFLGGNAEGVHLHGVEGAETLKELVQNGIKGDEIYKVLKAAFASKEDDLEVLEMGDDFIFLKITSTGNNAGQPVSDYIYLKDGQDIAPAAAEPQEPGVVTQAIEDLIADLTDESKSASNSRNDAQFEIVDHDSIILNGAEIDGYLAKEIMASFDSDRLNPADTSSQIHWETGVSEDDAVAIGHQAKAVLVVDEQGEWTNLQQIVKTKIDVDEVGELLALADNSDNDGLFNLGVGIDPNGNGQGAAALFVFLGIDPAGDRAPMDAIYLSGDAITAEVASVRDQIELSDEVIDFLKAWDANNLA